MAGTVATIGTFDGVHLGHQAVLAETERVASAISAERIACTFSIPPRRSLDPAPSPHLLLPLFVRERLLHRVVDRVVHIDFAEVRDLSPDMFVETFLVEQLHVAGVVVGAGFRFGRDRAGTLDTLSRLGKTYGFTVHSVKPVIVGREPVSSTRIRRQLADGHVQDAAALLGRPPVLVGHVIHGEEIGRRLGYPTANLRVDPRILLPGDGIYVAHVFWEGHRDHALLYVGSRPTLDTDERRCEVHLLTSNDASLYDTSMEVHVLERVQEGRAFPSLNDLRDQIARHVELATEQRVQHPLTNDPISG